MTSRRLEDGEDQALLDFLAFQRDTVLSIVAGLDEEAWVVPHMLEEPARHAGHLDIARELLDGETGLGSR